MDETRKTLSLYANSGWKSFFAKVRFWDAPYVEVEKLIPKKGLIVDLGCGEGIFTNFLGLSSKTRKVLGIEIDKKRLKIADRKLSNVSFKWGDATKVNFPTSDAIILFHLLHHLNSYNDQISLIKRCFNQLKDGGKLIIVEVDPRFSIKYLLAWVTDHFLVPLLFEKRFYSPIFFHRGAEWKKILSQSGFNCKIINVRKNYPFSHVIISCERVS